MGLFQGSVRRPPSGWVSFSEGAGQSLRNLRGVLRRILLTLADQKWIYRIIVGNAIFRHMAFRFVAGETLQDAVEAARRLNQKGIFSTLDLLGENVNTEAEARAACQHYVDAIDALGDGDANNVSLKLTLMGLDISHELCMENMRRILDAARARDTFVRIDMEGTPYTQVTIDIFSRLWQEYKNVGIVLQSYLYRSEQDVALANAMGARVRLCKGAYAEPPDLAFPKKSDVDANYNRLAERLILEGNYPGLATHDEAIIEHVKAFVRERNIPLDRFEFQMLYGIRRDLQEGLVSEGFRVRVYIPYGNAWYPYFMRRLAERPANVLFFLTSLLGR